MKVSIFAIILVMFLTACGGSDKGDKKTQDIPSTPVEELKYYEDISHFSGGYTPKTEITEGLDNALGEPSLRANPTSIDSNGNFVIDFGNSVLVGKLDIVEGKLVGEFFTIGDIERVAIIPLDTWIKDSDYAVYNGSKCGTLTSEATVYEDVEGSEHRHNGFELNASFNDCRGNHVGTARITLSDTYSGDSVVGDYKDDYSGNYYKLGYDSSTGSNFTSHPITFNIDYNGIITGSDEDGCEFYGYAENFIESQAHDVTLSVTGCELTGEYNGSIIPVWSGFKLTVSNDVIAFYRHTYPVRD